MALLPSLILILGTLVIVLLRGQRSRTVSRVSTGIALAAAVALFQQLPSETMIALWRPIELFGPGITFSVDAEVWPILLLASSAVLAEAVVDGRSASRLLYSGIALAAIASGALFTIAMLWTVMVLIEAALRLKRSMELEQALSRAGIQFIAVGALLGAISLGEGYAALLALAALIRSAGGAGKRFPFSLAILAPLGAMAAATRFAPEGSALLWIAAGGLAVAFIQSLHTYPRFSSLALGLTAAGFLAPPEAQNVAWVTMAAVLIATLGLHRAGGSRIAWSAVAIVPFAFVADPQDLYLLLLALIATTGLAILSRWQALNNRSWPPTRMEATAVAVLMVAAVISLVSSGWTPSLGSALAAGLGLAAGHVAARSKLALSKVLLPAEPLFERAKQAGHVAAQTLAATIRTVADVLEGESAVLWILLVLLLVIIGLQVVIA